jgi:cyclopropane-fatty-acyl-phospholipid synthase
MNHEATLPLARPTARRSSLAQRLVLRAFAAMPRGQLTLVLPDRTTLTFGRGPLADGAAPRAAWLKPARIEVRNPRFFRRCALAGDIGFAESYLAGEWDTPDLTDVIGWFILNHDVAPTVSGGRASAAGLNLLRWLNRTWHRTRANTLDRAVDNIREHYDLSNDFFALWLDPAMMYSCARWVRGDETLAEAQRAKNDALAKKLRLRAGDRVLEIGTGWGGWAIQAARDYGCHVTTLTLSPQQRALALQRIAEAGLADRIEVRLQDYRALPPGEVYDKIVSIEMLEAVGHEYLDDWCRAVARSLKPDGLVALQFIACADHRYEAVRGGVDFVQRHIFPGSLLLSVNRLNDRLAHAGGFVLHGLEEFGTDYGRTLRHWRERFTAALPQVHALGFDETFVRKWSYYFAYCEAAFALRHITVLQTVHSRPNNLSI